MSAGGDIDTVLDILQHVNVGSLKLTDQQVALSIGAIGGVPTRDRRGNVLDTLWVKYSEHSVVGMLLETNDIRKILLEQIQDQLKARRDLIQEVEQNEVVCKWLMAFTKSWETEYSNSIVTRFDIGQLILSAMDEAYFEVRALRALRVRSPACVLTNTAGPHALQPRPVAAQTLRRERHAALVRKVRGQRRQRVPEFPAHGAGRVRRRERHAQDTRREQEVRNSHSTPHERLR